MQSYDRKAQKKHPVPSMKGGLKATELPPSRIRVIGYPQVQYPAEQHGKVIQFERCFQYTYTDKNTHKMSRDTCVKKQVVPIPEKVFRCYDNTVSLLERLRIGKRGKPVAENFKALAMIACMSPTRVNVPVTPAVVAAAIGVPQQKVQKGIERYVQTGKIVTAQPVEFFNEKQHRLPPKYQREFEEFILGEAEARRIGVSRIFEEKPKSLAPEMPEAEPWEMTREGTRVMRRGRRRQEFWTPAMITRAMAEAETWKRRTGIAPPSYGGKIKRIKRPVKARKAPRRRDEWKRQAI